MFAKAKTSAVSHRFEPRERNNPFFPELQLRRRSNDHPMIMFATLAAIGLGSMALIPTAGPSLTSGRGEQVKMAEFVERTEKGDRVVPTEADLACRGQAWGNEDEACLTIIARDAGRKDTRQVRMIASAEPDSNRPNVF